MGGYSAKQITLSVVGFITTGFGIYFITPSGRRILQKLFSPSEELGKPVSIISLSIWFGLLIGTVEALILFNQNTFASHHFVWMVPLGEVLLYIIPGVILYLISKQRSQQIWRYVTFFVFSFLGYLSIFLLFERLHIYAQILLSIGLGVQTARFIMSGRKHFYSLVHLSFGWLIAGVFVIWAGMSILFP